MTKKRLVCEQCKRPLYLDDEGKLRDIGDRSVMCPDFDSIWHRAKE